MHRLFFFIVTSILFVTCLAVPSSSAAQRAPQQKQPPFDASQSKPGQAAPEDPRAKDIQKELEKERNRNRFQELKRDTDQLLELANQLKRYMDHTNENTLSLDVVRKAEEIEKLAKNIRNKMKAH